jgi:hypothetical protein
VLTYSYESTLAASEKVGWKVDDVIAPSSRFDFGKPFLPESLARTDDAPGLSERERLVLNQIRGHDYLCAFGLVEEFILPFVLDHVRPHLSGDDHRTRAFLQFAAEEAKHIHLFKRFREEFERGFGRRCEAIGPPEAVAREVLARPALSVALAILQIEWMTQRHYLDSIADDNGLDPQFKSLLRHHWMEEAQHARLDTLLVEELAAGLTPEEIERGVAGYFEIGAFIDAGIAQQAQFDADALERASGRKLPLSQRSELVAQQHQAMRWTYLGSGMMHPRFLETLEWLDPKHRAAIEKAAPTFA